jgi:hypothetical protein
MSIQVSECSRNRASLKHAVLTIFLLTACCVSTKGQEATTLIRLVQVSHSPNEAPFLIAKFVPVRSGYSGGGGKGPNLFPPPAVETVIGKEFTVSFIKRPLNAHEQTLCHVIQSCASKDEANTLTLHLVLSVPAATAKQLSYDGDRDFSQWVVMSVDTLK